MANYTQTLSERLNLNDSYGTPNNTTVYIYDSTNSKWIEVEGVEYFKIEKRLNQMSKFNMTLPQIETAQKLYIKEFAKVMLFTGTTLILKGRIQKVTYQTTYECQIEGFGMEAVILDKEYKNATRSPTDPDRVQYDNVSAQTIAKELLSTNATGASPWTMPPATDGIFSSDYGDISVRYEFANKLTALGNLANTMNYDWWISHDPISYTNDYFNISSIKGNQTAPDANRTFEITGANANCEGTDYQKDVTNLSNYLSCIGYGDGVNQISTRTYNASPIYSTLSANITATSVTIPLVDSSSFAANGTVRIAEEIITYTGNVANQLTGCTRGTSSTTAKAHRKGCYLEKYELSTAPFAGSSIDLNGLMDMTLTYRDVRDESTLELIASNELLNRMSPIERMTLIPTDPIATAENIETGDLITITDAESSISGNYRVVTIIYENNYGMLDISLEASNKSLTFIEQMQKEREKNQALQKYMQGSTNIYELSEKENCDNSKPLNMRFYIPSEAIAINKTLIKFATHKFRAYESASEVNSESSIIASSGSSASGVAITTQGSWVNVDNIETANTDCDGVFLDAHFLVTSISNTATSGTLIRFLYRIFDGTNYYPNSTGKDISGGWLQGISGNHRHDSGTYVVNPDLAGTSAAGGADGHTHTSGFYALASGDVSGTSGYYAINKYSEDINFCLSDTISQYVPGNQKNKIFTFQIKYVAGPADFDWYVNGGIHYKTISRHTHNMNYAIYENTFPTGSPVVAVAAGIEGSESPIPGSPFSISDGGIYSADITSIINSVGAGEWCNIKFTPSSGSDHNLIRIEANAVCQIFIESTT